MEKYIIEQIAEDACLAFRQTFSSPDEILKIFRGNIKKRMRHLNKGGNSPAELDGYCRDFATEVFENMFLISADVIREKLSKEVDLKNYKSGADLSSKEHAKHFEHFSYQIMEILINVVYKEKKDSKGV